MTREILIVDDDSQLFTAIDTIVKDRTDCSWVFLYSDSPESALIRLPNDSPALLILNIEMPHAFKVLESARQKGIPTFLSINSSLESLVVARFIEYDFLIKPLNPSTVFDQIEKKLAGVCELPT